MVLRIHEYIKTNLTLHQCEYKALLVCLARFSVLLLDITN